MTLSEHPDHLTEFEIDELLLGECLPAAQAHLATCEACAARRDALVQPLTSFAAVSLAWAEQRSAAMPLPLGAEAMPSAFVPGYLRDELLRDEHLSDDQLDAVLIEGPSPAAAAHLSACSPCTVRLDAIAQPVASFRAVSLAWSERRSATLPLREENFNNAPRGWVRRYGWIAATAAVLAVAIGVPMHRSGLRQPAAPAPGGAAIAAVPAGGSPTAVQTPVEVANVAPPPTMSARPSAAEMRRQRQIDADNQMLAAIDHELDASQATLTAYGVNVSTSAAHSRGRGAVAQE